MTDFASQSSKKKTCIGTKARQRTDDEDRSLIYRDFRRLVGNQEKDNRIRKTAYTTDLDQVEYIFINGIPIPIAILEITRYDFDEYEGNIYSWIKYRTSILNRYFLRDAQGKVIQALAAALKCRAFIVLFRKDLGSFWIFDMIDKNADWIHKDQNEYKQWLIELREQALKVLNKHDN